MSRASLLARLPLSCSAECATPTPLSLLNHSALALFAQRTRIPTSTRGSGFCATIWVCISSRIHPAPCSFGEDSPPWPSDRRVMVTRRVASLMNGAYNFIIFMYHLAYGRQFAHSTAYITSISSSTPSSTACPVGVQFSPRKRGGSALRSSTTIYCGMLFWSRAHRSIMAVCVPSVAHLPR